FFSSRRRHTRSKRDWSSDVCSSDLIFRENVRIDVTYRVDHPKQGKRIMHSTGDPVAEDGMVTRLIGNTLDITEQENAAQGLQRSEVYLSEGEGVAYMGSRSLKADVA